ncbi:20703_t:CDS:2, partial [Gigaspora margarita]
INSGLKEYNKSHDDIMKLISLEDSLKISIDVIDKIEEACGFELKLITQSKNCQKWTKYFKYIIEWIPYGNIREIRKLNNGGFGTVYGA